MAEEHIKFSVLGYLSEDYGSPDTIPPGLIFFDYKVDYENEALTFKALDFIPLEDTAPDYWASNVDYLLDLYKRGCDDSCGYIFLCVVTNANGDRNIVTQVYVDEGGGRRTSKISDVLFEGPRLDFDIDTIVPNLGLKAH